MYLSLAGQKLCVDQVELPEALPLSLECCCIVPTCYIEQVRALLTLVPAGSGSRPERTGGF